MDNIVRKIQEIENEAINLNKILYATQAEKIDALLDLTLFRLDVRFDSDSNLDLFEVELPLRNQSIISSALKF
jgi:hypothetical protein